jgi:trigger factor
LWYNAIIAWREDLPLKVSTETVATREVTLTIEPDPERVQRAMRDAARQISRYRPVPGFRPGRAPYAMVERIFGRDVILNEALNGMADSLYHDAVTEAGIEPYEHGQLEIESQDPLVLKTNVPLVPDVTLGNVEELSIEPEPEVAITEEQIDEEIERLRRAHAQYEAVERGAERGDQLVAAITGTAGEEQVIDRPSATFDLDDELQPPGFAEALVGQAAGETRSFSLTYPEDFEDEDVAGKNVDFEVTVNTVRKRTLPEVNDDLAMMVGDYDTLAELREALGQQLKTRLQNEARAKETEAAIDALVSVSTVEYPDAALQHEISDMLGAQRSRLQQIGFTWENYLRMVGKTEQELRDEVREDAERRLVRRLVLTEYARAEDIKVDPAEVGNIVSDIAASYGDRAEEAMRSMTNSGVMLSIYADLMTQKAARRLTAKLTGREEELEDEEASSDEAATEEAAPEEATAEQPSAEAEDEESAKE